MKLKIKDKMSAEDMMECTTSQNALQDVEI
jgi:hypothetical protein